MQLAPGPAARTQALKPVTPRRRLRTALRQVHKRGPRRPGPRGASERTQHSCPAGDVRRARGASGPDRPAPVPVTQPPTPAAAARTNTPRLYVLGTDATWPVSPLGCQQSCSWQGKGSARGYFCTLRPLLLHARSAAALGGTHAPEQRPVLALTLSAKRGPRGSTGNSVPHSSGGPKWPCRLRRGPCAPAL